MLAKKYMNISFTDISKLLKSKIHEERLIALLILVFNFQKKTENQDKIFSFYLKNRKYIDNWDLVDLSAYKIIGKYLFEKDKSLLYEMVNSNSLWDRRIAIVSTLYFIRNQKFDDTVNIAKILLNDKQDLIHKAVGWMLREIGKRNEKLLEKFLKENYKKMPRTMLRYAIEKFSEEKRKSYLNKNYKLIINKN